MSGTLDIVPECLRTEKAFRRVLAITLAHGFFRLSLKHQKCGDLLHLWLAAR
jgi:hypothetical protein